MFLSTRTFSFALERYLAVFLTTVLLTFAACASEPSGSGASEWSGTPERQRLLPSYSRGPQIRNNP